MKKHLLFKSKFLMMIVIIICFNGVIYTDSLANQKLVEENVESVVQMTSRNIKTEIENGLSNQLTVAGSMANDTFLQSWLQGESEHLDDEEYLKQLYQYLNTYKNLYGYTTVFCVSEESGNYYYQKGYNKTMQKGNEHDIWYYNFLDMNQDYDIQVDTDEINGNIPTIFINYRTTDANGKVLGVVGVAVELTDVQVLINQYEINYDLSIYLINRGGAKNSFSQRTHHFIEAEDVDKILGMPQKEALSNSESGNLRWRTKDGMQTCTINTYASSLKWNIIIVKNVESLTKVFLNRLLQNIVAVIGILAACISITTFIFLQYHHQMVQLENVDDLTGLANRKLFEQLFEQIMKKKLKHPKAMFMLDVDDFKSYNDTKGHLYGNLVLAMVGKTIKQTIAPSDVAARWGGDEFIGIINGTADEAEVILKKVMEILIQADASVTLSVGIIELRNDESLHNCMNRVDQALYKVKENGKNGIIKL
ncbi:MAG: sensor domain-containing diguanylate cyclase [Lachnospiraceae bacterium]|nr:sensor domain-containing diguanylate cyclase [Lachnospiraceae bacterium]